MSFVMMNTGEFGETPTLYQVLGVAETATLDEIKRAYYQQVRLKPAHRDPDWFQLLNEAGRTLTDARRRGEYDQLQRSGRRIQILVDQAAVALERDNQKAITLLKSAIALAPDVPRPRHLLAHVLMKVEEYTLAEKQYRWLLRESPRDETLLFKLGRCLYQQNKRDEAERALRRALQINTYYHDAWMLLSRIAEEQEKYDEAEEALSRAIQNDDRENYADADALFRLVVLGWLVDHENNQEPLIQRFLAVIPTGESEEQQQKAERAVRKVLKRAQELYRTGNYMVSRQTLEVALRMPIPKEELRTEIEDFARRVTLTQEAKQAETDVLLPPTFQEIFALKYQDRYTDSQRKVRLEAVLSAIQQEILNKPEDLKKTIQYVTREYPRFAEDQNALLAELMNRVNKRLELMQSASTHVMPGVSDTSTPQTTKPDSDKSRRGIFDIFRGKR
ncbi:MAG: hypothetical protein OHK0029_40450 [Armatimonadaceae bacterium]